MKRISIEQAQFQVPLDPVNDPLWSDKVVAFTLEQVDDKWQEVRYYGEAIMDSSGSVRSPQWVYVLVNKSIPGICKIGMTTKTVPERVKEINSATGVITPWFPVYKHKCVNAREVERDTHVKLEQLGYRVNPNREGFEVSSHLAIEVIKEIADRYY
jgi:hypothetical protein